MPVLTARVPADVTLRETLAFIQPQLAGRRRVLEVGCGRGELAARLAAAGW
jgi:cyclopropane fatty-acyl-phospholipid synthase-like methyltransferase